MSLTPLFTAIVRHPWRCLLPLAALLIVSLAGLGQLVKDTRSDAFLAQDNPALVYRDIVREQFGLTDPMLVALVVEGGTGGTGEEGEGESAGIYRADVLAFIKSLTADVQALPNVDADNTLSLATESLMVGSAMGIDVIPPLDPLPETDEEIADLRAQVEDFPLFLGALVARDGSTALIAANLHDEDQAEATYRDLLDLLATQAVPQGVTVHVAGEGAIAGYLGAYIDADAQRLNPLASVIIVITLIIAFRRLAPALLAVLVILGSVGAALGSMALAGIPFFVITNALPVILIGISVADTIHIFSEFYERQARAPQVPRDEHIVATMDAMWLPVTVTSLTTAAGFLGLYLAAEMPPFRYFGLFAAVGVAAAWLYSLVGVPACMQLMKVQVAQRFINQRRAGDLDALSRALRGLGSATLRRPRVVLAAFAALALAGAWGASHLSVDADRIGLFHPDEPIVAADRAINRHLDGSNTLDVVIETGAAEGLYDPGVLARMDALQQFALGLPHVQGATSIVDYLKQMNRILNDGDAEFYRVPETREEVAQFFLLYSFSADPDDFSQEVDYDYRTANVRITMNDGGYQQIKVVHEALAAYLDTHFGDAAPADATLTGRVSLNYHWIRNIGDSHVQGLLASLLLVWLVSAASFRSPLAGGYTLIPVVAAILIVYAWMVVRGLTLGVGTSMFAAVAVGLGVDFAIHSLTRLQRLPGLGPEQVNEEHDAHDAQKAGAAADPQGSENEVYAEFFTSTGRALSLNVLAVACGFGVLLFSRVGQLRDFGSIVVISMVIAFFASVTLLPALLVVLRRRAPAAIPTVLMLALAVSLALPGADARAQETLSAADIVARVNAMPQGEQVSRALLFRTIDKRGRERERETFGFRRYFGEERRQVLFFTAPANIRDTAVLTWDYPDTNDDDQWMYLPALRKVRRIPSADRGDYFLGTDFSFEDMKLDGKLSVEDYDYTLLDSEEPGQFRLSAVPKTEDIAGELGYSKNEIVVDASNWMVTQVEFWDTRGEHLKTLRAGDIRRVDDIWTRHRLVMENHQTGHSTELLFTDIDYRTPVDEDVFTQRALKRGL